MAKERTRSGEREERKQEEEGEFQRISNSQLFSAAAAAAFDASFVRES